ncbi:MAG: hypothetical protein KJ587_02220 [Alphaproteobacteria bacterium]|nr:hypothetical protein [Alphaproteobacteria bacterium]
MIDDPRKRIAGSLQRLWLAALACGAVTFLAGFAWVSSSGGPGFDWIWAVAAFGLAAVVYNIAFFVLCSVFVPGLSTLVEDATQVHGDDVTHVVKHAETGNKTIDFYIRAYATARGTTAVAIVSGVMAAIALTFF